MLSFPVAETKSSHKSNLTEKGLILVHSSRTAHHGGEFEVAAAGARWLDQSTVKIHRGSENLLVLGSVSPVYVFQDHCPMNDPTHNLDGSSHLY